MPRPLSVKSAGAKGGKARAVNLTPAQRSDAARKAARARWAEYHRIQESMTPEQRAQWLAGEWPT